MLSMTPWIPACAGMTGKSEENKSVPQFSFQIGRERGHAGFFRPTAQRALGRGAKTKQPEPPRLAQALDGGQRRHGKPDPSFSELQA